MRPRYFDAYPNIAFQRDERGVLEFRLHTGGHPFQFSAHARTQLIEAFHAVGSDRNNRVVIFTGTGEAWCAQFDSNAAVGPDPALSLAERWNKQFWEGRKLLQNLLDIDVPVIAAVNGPALVHSEYILTCDIVIASADAIFQDLPHLNNQISPTDGVHVLWPHVLGPGRGRDFLLTQQAHDAREALALGVCQEVVPRDRLLDRAYAIATMLSAQPTITLRCARVGLTHRLKRLLADDLAAGLAVESVSALSKALQPPP